jgi:hypothetical protein
LRASSKIVQIKYDFSVKDVPLLVHAAPRPVGNLGNYRNFSVSDKLHICCGARLAQARPQPSLSSRPELVDRQPSDLRRGEMAVAKVIRSMPLGQFCILLGILETGRRPPTSKNHDAPGISDRGPRPDVWQ